MLNVRCWEHSLPFVYPFTISKGTKTHQSTFIVELEWRGIKAYGEAPAISYYEISVADMKRDLMEKLKFIESFSFMDPKRFWHFLHHLFPKNHFLVCALDMAGWDLFGKMNRKPIHQLLSVDPTRIPFSDYTIGIATKEEMLNKLQMHPSPAYKIKVGSPDDLDKLIDIRKATDAILRIDANAGWTLEQAIQFLPILEEIHIELIEQPFPKDDLNAAQQFMKMTEIPIIADESCVTPSDIDKCYLHFTGINIKLTKSGGITPALEMIQRARRLGMKVMLGCMNECSIGTAALAQLAPLADFLDADGPLLLGKDLAKGIQWINHTPYPSSEPGLGIQPIQEMLEAES
ncbi:MAG: dipeptide epimerase [Chitinophagaceae bacterium]|jgi:L-alanine-DL-glutamate epimerase-like enolase superfamily enzyme